MQHRSSILLPARRLRRGFTLLEALMSTTLLLIIVIAVTSAVAAGQQHALEARDRIAGAMAAESMIGRIEVMDYTLIPAWDGYSEAVGMMQNATGNDLPPAYRNVGRSVDVQTVFERIEELGVNIRGRRVVVTAFDAGGRELIEVTRFIPEPQS